MIDFARRRGQVDHVRYDEAIDVESLTKSVTDHIQEYTQTGGARPFGVALLVGGVDNGEPRLFETDPSGTPYEWKATAIGGGRDEIQTYLEDNYEEDLDLGGGIGLALEGLAQPAEDGIEASGIEMTTIDVESGRVSQVDEETIAEHIDERDLGAENEE